MKVRGQNPDAWLARWQQGTCPVHGRGLAAAESGDGAEADEGVAVTCSHEDCELGAHQWRGKDEWHSVLGWASGPEEIKAVLLKAGLIEDDSPRPGKRARNVRTSWPLGEGDFS